MCRSIKRFHPYGPCGFFVFVLFWFLTKKCLGHFCGFYSMTETESLLSHSLHGLAAIFKCWPQNTLPYYLGVSQIRNESPVTRVGD